MKNQASACTPDPLLASNRKMKLLLSSALLLPFLAGAAVLPDAIGAGHCTAASPPALTDRAVWEEYGLKDSESAACENGAARFTVTAYRLQDATGALAAFDWQRPANAKPKGAGLAAETPTGLLLVHGNYLLVFQGYTPAGPEIEALTASLRNVESTLLPTLPGYLPSLNLAPNSERYITGPASLQKFIAGIPPSVAAFHLGAEAETGVFHSPKGDTTLTIFNYPTPQIAMRQVEGFEKLPGAMAKRSGPLVAVILSPPDPNFAERLLAEVRYQAQVTRDEYVPTRRDNIGDLILNIFVLIGILLLISLAGGVAMGGFRVLLRWVRKGEEPEPMIRLHLEQR